MANATAGIYLDTTDQEQALSDIIPMTADLAYPGAFPGYVGIEQTHSYTQAYIPRDLPVTIATDTPDGNIDYSSWGENGEVDRNPYSMLGPVEPNQVENFSLTGQVATGQRRPEYGDGPVGAYDHAAYTVQQIAQQMADVAYNEASLVSLLTGGNIG